MAAKQEMPSNPAGVIPSRHAAAPYALRMTPAFALCFLACASMLLSGCAAAGVAAYKIAGPPEVPAKYAPDKSRPMLVLVENYQYPTATRNDSEQIGRYVYEELRAHDVVPLKSPDDLYQLRAATGIAFGKMTIGEIGRKLGAAQVLYINLTHSHVEATPGSDMLKGALSCLVKVVDAKTNATLWPQGGENGYPVSVETPFVHTKEDVDESSLREQMYDDLAGNIAKLFYNWKPESLENQE